MGMGTFERGLCGGWGRRTRGGDLSFYFFVLGLPLSLFHFNSSFPSLTFTFGTVDENFLTQTDSEHNQGNRRGPRQNGR